MFSIVVYGQLILEQAQLEHLDPDILNQIFDFMVRDFARFALQIYGLSNCRDEQRTFCREIMLIRPAGNDGPVPAGLGKGCPSPERGVCHERIMNE